MAPTVTITRNTTIATLNGETWGSGNSEATRTIPLDTFLPSTQDVATIPDGMFYDYYGNKITPGESGFAGAVQSVPSTAETSANRSRIRDGLRLR